MLNSNKKVPKVITQYRIKIKSIIGAEMGMNSSFESKRAFMKNDLWVKIKDGGISGTIVIQYPHGYTNEFVFNNIDQFTLCINASTEKALLDDFRF